MLIIYKINMQKGLESFSDSNIMYLIQNSIKPKIKLLLNKTRNLLYTFKVQKTLFANQFYIRRSIFVSLIIFSRTRIIYLLNTSETAYINQRRLTYLNLQFFLQHFL